MAEHGGKREGAGRKSKAEEQDLAERLAPLTEKGFKALENGLEDDQSWAVKLFLEYHYGKPKQSIEQKNINYNQELTKEDIKLIDEELEKKY